jgi:hypothetical protein
VKRKDNISNVQEVNVQKDGNEENERTDKGKLSRGKRGYVSWH